MLASAGAYLRPRIKHMVVIATGTRRLLLPPCRDRSASTWEVSWIALVAAVAAGLHPLQRRSRRLRRRKTALVISSTRWRTASKRWASTPLAPR